MPTVLIPVFSYPPLNTGGTFRLLKFADYLPDAGWTPLVVAPDWSEANIQEGHYDPSLVGRSDVRVERVSIPHEDGPQAGLAAKASAFLRADIAWPYPRLEQKILARCREICRDEEIDIIFASSFPLSIHRIGKKLHREFDIPWVADHRDILDQDDATFAVQSVAVKWCYGLWQKRRLEQEAANSQSAAVVTTVSEGLAERLRTRNRAPVEVITNGFDPNDFSEFTNSKPKNSNLTITYAGSLFGERNPKVFLEGLELFLEKSVEGEKTPSVRVQFFGQSCDQIQPFLAARKKLKDQSDVIVRGGFLPHGEVLKKMAESDVLYLISHPQKGIVTGKIFEYLALGRPILSVPGDGDATDQILAETNAGKVAHTPQEVADALTQWYAEWSQEGTPKNTTREETLERYTRQALAGQLAGILDRVQQRYSAEPLVSIVIPAYNAAPFLERALQSVLDQTYTNYEVVFIDDGSEDDTSSVVERFSEKFGERLRYVHQENAGVSAARNHGIEIARGDWILFFDADDEMLPEMVQSFVKQTAEFPEATVVSGAAIYQRDTGSVRIPPEGKVTTGIVDFLRVSPKHSLTAAKIMARRDLLQQLGGFNTHLRMAEDIDLWGRLACSCPRYSTWCYLDQVVATYHHVHTSAVNTQPAKRWFKGEALPFSEELPEEFPEERRKAFRQFRQHHFLVLATQAALADDFPIVRRLLREAGAEPGNFGWWALSILAYVPGMRLCFQPFRWLLRQVQKRPDSRCFRLIKRLVR